MKEWGSKVLLGCVLFLLPMLVSAPLTAQEVTASIRGVVLDPSGAVVPSAEVTATQTDTGLMRTAVSDARGTYVLVLLPIGHYRLTASAKGFGKFVQDGITLSVNEAATFPSAW